MADLKTEVMIAQLYYYAVIPSLQVLLDDDQEFRNSFFNVEKTFQLGSMYRGDLLCCTIRISDCKISVEEGSVDKPDFTMTFNSVWKMNEYLRGGLVIPKVSGSSADKKLFGTLVSGVKYLSKPNNKLKDDQDRALKSKFALYTINRALSKYNKLGDPDMQEFCEGQPDRIYRITVDHGRPDFISCFFRICDGRTRAGHGDYDRLEPFVEFRLKTLDDILNVISGKYSLMEAVEYNFAVLKGDEEYALTFSDFFSIVLGLFL